MARYTLEDGQYKEDWSDVIAALPNDATRVNRPIYIPQSIQLR